MVSARSPRISLDTKMLIERSDCVVMVLIEVSKTGGTRTYAKQLIGYYQSRVRDLVVVGVSDDDAALDEFRDQATYRFFAMKDFFSDEQESPGAYIPFRLRSQRTSSKRMFGDLNPNLIVASVGTPGMFMSFLGRGRRSLYILHTYPGKKGRGSFYHLVRGMILRFLLPRGIRFVTVSEFSRERIERVWGLRFPRGIVRVIHNTAGPPLSNPVSPSAGSLVLTIGHVVEYKNPDTWFSVAKMVLRQRPATKFVWVGPGPMLDTYRGLVKESRLDDRILFVGAQKDVTEYLKVASIYLQTSRVESLGIAALEAMRFGLPLIVSKIGGLPEVVSHGQNGFVVPVDDELEMVRKILFLLDSPGEREKMGVTSLQRYEAHFSSKKWEAELDQLHLNWAWKISVSP